MNSTDDSLPGRCAIPPRDRRNQRQVALWSLVWALSFTAVTLVIKKEWLPPWAVLVGVLGTALLGLATVLAYRRFLREADELRRKIEMEALALAFGVGVIGGMTYWLLTLSGNLPATDFVFVFFAMIVTHSVGSLLGHRRYS